MDFDEAIKAHSAWKMKLSKYIAKPDGSLVATDVGVDNKCPLGQWIHGEGGKHSSVVEFKTLKDEHAKFHKCAADVIKKADSGADTSQETALGGSSEFSKTSTNVVSAIMAIKRKVAA